MSTRSCIARLVDDGKFLGTYHHWDGYPSGLGETLFGLYNGFFKKDLDAMLKYLIDDHPAGWSTINNRDLSKTPGYRNHSHYTEDEENKKKGILPAPECFCHGDRSEEGRDVTEQNAAGSGCEWAYAFTQRDGKNLMVVLSSYRRNGYKMIGMFGFGDENAIWKTVGVVDLDGPEPDWEKIGADEE